MKQSIKPSYTLHKNFRLPMGFPPENFDSGLTYQAQATDTFIATYPKCGTTWTQHIVWMLSHDGKPLPLDKNINLEVPHLEEVGSNFVKSLSEPRFIKTHLTYDLTPYNPDAKYIYVARNPFDCAVSFYYHTQGFVKHYNFAEGTFDDFFECFINGEVDWGDYFDNLLGWVQHKNDENVLFLTYESMKNNPKINIIAIAKFLGDNYAEKIENPQILESILEHTSFTRMSKNQSRWSSQRPDNMAPFIRKGKVGDWKSHFSASQTQRLSQKLRMKTAGTEAENLWEIPE
ncbi:MAG: sulfotransferase domain-containing protein [Okeania sp. SIO3I5]|uniref:sulfotransferase domain-containing protein n=1 Tax=Okeania sp. SIO3I5 TaxID=2607805 RepID=UPI0013B8072F|nr:sulfotransferase domain-containing protein [Okeania sp. SIO3I5]NEQ37849.1 sulfotransferase domain-containing protein [Okeania sp. SIO3I5]